MRRTKITLSIFTFAITTVYTLTAADSDEKWLYNTFCLEVDQTTYVLKLNKDRTFDLSGPNGDHVSGKIRISFNDKAITLSSGELKRYFRYDNKGKDLKLTPRENDVAVRGSLLGDMPPTDRSAMVYLTESNWTKKGHPAAAIARTPNVKRIEPEKVAPAVASGTNQEHESKETFENLMKSAAELLTAQKFDEAEQCLMLAQKVEPPEAPTASLLSMTRAFKAYRDGRPSDAQSGLEKAYSLAANYPELQKQIKQSLDLVRASNQPLDPNATYELIQTPVRHTEGEGIPLILVHGLSSEFHENQRWSKFIEHIQNDRAFRWFDIYLWKHDTSEPIGFNGYTGNAKELAFVFSKYFTGKKVMLIAHSRGGLVCRAFMNYQHQGDQVLGLITLGTPHHGTPLAIPDWAAYYFSNINDHPISNEHYFNVFYGCEPDAHFCIKSIGQLNLAWDNLDGAITTRKPLIRYPAKIGSNGILFELTLSDMNDILKTNDITPFYSPSEKERTGNLADLNRSESYFGKIVTFGAYRSKLKRKTGIELEILPDEIDAPLKGWLGNDHQALWLATKVLAGLGAVADDRVNYYANDGLVPLQSSLFLDLNSGYKYAVHRGDQIIGDEIILIDANIKASIQTKHAYILSEASGQIKDHLDLLESDNLGYWNAIDGELSDFRSKNGKMELGRPSQYEPVGAWVDRAADAVKLLASGKNAAPLAEKVLSITHFTGNSAKLSDVKITKLGGMLVVAIRISWTGGFSSNSYSTEVTWKFEETKHLVANVTDDNAQIGVSPHDNQELDNWFRDSVYPLLKQ